MSERHWVCAVVAFVALSGLGREARAEADPGTVASAMRAVAAAIPPAADEMESEVPASIGPPLQQLRNALRALAVADAAELEAKARPEVFAAQVTKQLVDAGIAVGPAKEKGTPTGRAPDWGRIEAIHAWSPPTSGGRMVVDVTWGMPCGTDTTSWVFEVHQGKWALVLADESPKFDAENHAVAIVGTNKPGDFLMFTAHTPVWCTSVWSSLRYSVLGPGATPLEPTRKFGAEASANRMCGSVQKLDVRKNQISFRYVGARPDDPAEPVLFQVTLRIDKDTIAPVGADRMVRGVPCP